MLNGVDDDFWVIVDPSLRVGAGSRTCRVERTEVCKAVVIDSESEFRVDKNVDRLRVLLELLPEEVGMDDGLVTSGSVLTGEERASCKSVRHADQD